MEVRIKDHESAIKTHELGKSGLHRHAWSEHHRFKWEQIVHKENQWYERKFIHAAYITPYRNIIIELMETCH